MNRSVVAVAVVGLLSQACGSNGTTGGAPTTSTPTAAPRKVSFASPATYPGAQGPIGIFTADFNRDAKPDLVFFSVYRPSFSVLRNDGDGAFHELDIPLGDVSGLAVADFDGDGLTDLAIADRNRLTTQLGNGDGTFRSPPGFRIDLSDGATQAVAGDVNGDGAPDLLVGTGYGFTVLLGRGDGHLSRTGRNFASIRDNGGALTVGDFNGDGKLDVVMVDYRYDASPRAGVAIALGNGDATFQPWRLLQAGPEPSPAYPTAADLNGDGRLDLVVGNLRDGKAAEGSVAILLGKGDGTFQAPQLYEAGPGHPVIADFNGDGIPDIAAPRLLRHDVAVVTGNGEGSFGAPVFFATGRWPLDAVTADFNGDGQPDIAVTSRDGNFVSILFSNR